MRVAVYYRVSTKGQGDDDAYGLPRQHAEIEAYVQREGHEIVATFEDIGCSGASADRPGLADLLAGEGFEAVIVPAWDRLARDAMLDGYLRFTLKKKGVAVLSATQDNGVDPTSVMIQAILAAVAGYERHLITKRLEGSRKAKARAGGYAHGTAPYGTQAILKTGRLHPNEAEIGNLRRMQELRATGLSLREIAAEMNAEGRVSRKGLPWSHVAVSGALASADRVERVLSAQE